MGLTSQKEGNIWGTINTEPIPETGKSVGSYKLQLTHKKSKCLASQQKVTKINN